MVKIFILISLCSTLKIYSQNVGIGTNLPTNKLHVVAETDPIRIEGLQPGSITDSIVTVDQTGVFGKRSLSLTGWSVTGNNGTSNTTNFLGTTDNKPLLIRTNNQPSALIDPGASSRNNAFGNGTFSISVTGAGNNAFGYQALNNLTTGGSNTVIGDSAAFNLTAGAENIALGRSALLLGVTATGNVAIGSNALRNNLAAENIAIGKNAASSNTSGSNVLALGSAALLNNRTGNTQLAIGNNALQGINGGLENVAIGYNAGASITSSSYNVLLGHYTLGSATTASRNTVIGHNAGLAYTGTGNTDNTFIGYQSALSQTAGTGNTYIGAGVDVAGAPTVNNSSALGQNVQITASNQVRIGNAAITSIGGQVGWTTFSDARIKKNVQEDVPGLSFIEKLRPVTYNYDMQALQKMQGGKPLASATTAAFENTRFSGLLAQEVESAALTVGYDFSGIDKPSNEQTPYGLRYAELVVPMIKAMQEMKKLIDAQQQEINELKAKMKD